MAYSSNFNKIDDEVIKTQVKGGRLKTFNGIFDNASLFAWKDLRKKKFSPHDLRDVLQSALERPEVRINPNLIAPLISHIVKGTDKFYSSHDISEYLTAFKLTLPFIVPKTVAQVQNELEETTKENQRIAEQQSEQMEKMQTQLAKMQKIVEHYEVVMNSREAGKTEAPSSEGARAGLKNWQGREFSS